MRRIVLGVMLAVGVAGPSLAADKKPAQQQAAEVAAPFGLRWGMTKSELEGAVGVLGVGSDGNGNAYTSGKAPISLGGFSGYVYIIDADVGLVKVIALSEDIINDPYGSEGKEKFEYFHGLVSDKYGKPSKKYSYSGNALYKEADEFYQCLAYPGCGAMSSFWIREVGSIGLELKGGKRGSGYIRLGFEGPKFSEYIKGMKDKKKENDKKAM